MSDSWWTLVLFMYLTGDLGDHMQQIQQEAAAKEAFEEYARGCPHLELDNDGRAMHHICRHPVRDDPSNWVVYDRRACPFMASNASPEEMERYTARLVADSTNVFCRGDHPCEGCAHLEWEADMGKHLPYCELDGKFDPVKCDKFEPSRLYSMYMKIAHNQKEGGTHDRQPNDM